MTSHPPPFRARLKSAEVQPSASEQALFDLLLEAAATAEPPPTLRAAGGWVRDALLGGASPDIDIALERSTGEAFALVLAAHVAAKSGGPAPSVVVIEANPDQSKHLATARTKVLGQWLDLVNLRSEEYASGSRIPVAKEGTPLQDALRRDFTVNALFYNLHSRCVEDFTGRGLADLSRGLIKTPLPPKETFLDDPLRVLRALRFGARLGFDLDDDLLVAAADEEVHAALRHKVSRDRIGAEVEGMLLSVSPLRALSLLHDLGLWHVVFALPGADGAEAKARRAAPAGLACARIALGAWERLEAASGGRAEASEQEGGVLKPGLDAPALQRRRLLLLAAALFPIREERVRVRNRPAPLASRVLLEGLKGRSRDAEAVATLAEAALSLHAASRAGEADAGAGPGSRVALGRAVRLAGPLWAEACALSALAGEGWAAGEKPGAVASSAMPAGVEEVDRAVARAAEAARGVMAAVEGHGLVGCWEWKPPLHGGEVMRLTGVKGIRMGPVMKELVDWRLQNPQKTAEEAEAWLLRESEWAREKEADGRDESPELPLL